MYDEIKQFIAFLLNAKGDTLNDLARIVPHYIVMDEAIFLFSDELCEWIESLQKDCQSFIVADANKNSAYAKYAEMQRKLLDQARELSKRFEKEIGLNQLQKMPSSK